MSMLRKDFQGVVIPGTAGQAGSPGSPAVPERWTTSYVNHTNMTPAPAVVPSNTALDANSFNEKSGTKTIRLATFAECLILPTLKVHQLNMPAYTEAYLEILRQAIKDNRIGQPLAYLDSKNYLGVWYSQAHDSYGIFVLSLAGYIPIVTADTIAVWRAENLTYLSW